MVAFTKLNGFVEHRAHGVHNLGSDELKIALTNTAPGAESSDPSVATADCVLASLTEISYTNVVTSGSGSRVLTVSSSGQSSGTYKLVLADMTITATGGAIAGFRYIYLYNNTPSSPADPLIGLYDYGSTLTLAENEALLLDFDATNGVIQDA